MDGDIFENAPRVETDVFYTDKKDAFSKISGYVWPRPKTSFTLYWDNCESVTTV